MNASSTPQEIGKVEVWVEDPSLGGNALAGYLTRQNSRRGDTLHFEYAAGWLANETPVRAFALDPQLPLHAGVLIARAGASELSAAFLDCSPDRWGKLLMKRKEVIQAREQGRKVRALRPWDYLIGVNDVSRMGALRLKDSVSGRFLDDHALSAPPLTQLRELEAIARRLEHDEIGDNDTDLAWIKQLIAPGASLGGARPKASVREADDTLWLAKFPSAEDDYNVGRWEYITYRLALSAGISMSTARPLELSKHGTTYAVQRFDRTPQGRRTYASALTLLDVDHSEESSYVDIAHAIEMFGAAHAIQDDLHQLFRRVAFNVLIGNRDDHLRNHGFLREPAGWRLAPAFDVNPNQDKDAHVLAIGLDDPTPRIALLMETHAYYRLSKPQALTIIEDVRAAVARWQQEALRCNASRSEIAAMEAVIDPAR
ncbi:hypothetical protein NC00_08920 [Xanthomonas cannabis pv. phaseoli]|uniref:HipA-like C-terminal domain-containing protein n=1 Tax=Xanthomonas cannabis pv. phaseoli TaxID=1885902 RepID=A0AB34P9V4_9XANT|nr:HipA domain-containing protein [Xanthomonas cannabis]KGK58126.1 hypothetical protein NC00_08920 [Xanthomonas cannabis pv. phaseoli]MBB3804713.1 serine/threonine-protein kinase HipA [Xanthomonas cannabis]